MEVDTSRSSSTLHSFDCVGGRVSSSYKFKFLRAATCMPTALMGTSDGDKSGVASRVQMDAQGMLMVQHLLHIARPASTGGGGGGGFGGGVHHYTSRPTAGGTMDSLADPSVSLPHTGGGGTDTGGGSVVVPVTFVLFPEEAAAADAQADDDAREAGPAPPAGAAPRGSPEL